MNILFFVYDYSIGNNNSNLQKDMIKIFSEKGENVYVISMSNNKEIKLIKEGNITILYLNTGITYQIKNKLKKAWKLFYKDICFKKNYFKYFGKIKMDLIIGYAPYNANVGLVKKIKKKYSCKTLLMIWDFFPDNAKDLGIIKNKFLYSFFKYKEKLMYKNYDILIVNSEGGKEYLKNNYKLPQDKIISLIRNCEYISKEKFGSFNKEIIKKELGYTREDKILLFGGNIGIFQQVENIVKLAEKIAISNVKFLIVGYGTEKEKIKDIIKEKKLSNIMLIDSLEKNKYENLVRSCDVGLISLNKNLTVPNAPTKITSYLKYGIPIFAILDDYTKKDLGSFLIKNEIGEWISAKNVDYEYKVLEEFLNKICKINYSKNCKLIYEKEFDIEKAYNTIMRNIGEENGR